MGIEPIDKIDDDVHELKNRGIDDVLAAKQEAYLKYLKRYDGYRLISEVCTEIN